MYSIDHEQDARKPAMCPQSQEPKEEKRILSCEDAENEVIQRFEENEETRKMIVRLAKGNNDDMERWMQIYREMTELDYEQKMAVANGIRRTVEARRKGQIRRENAEDEVMRYFEETEETRKMIGHLAKGSNSDMVKWLQNYTKLSGLDDEQKKTEANGIRRAVEASRNCPRREPTTAQKQGKKVCFTEEEKEAQEGREWQ